MRRFLTRTRFLGLPAAVSLLLAGCALEEPAPVSWAPVFLSPTAGTALTRSRVEVAVLIPEAAPDGRLHLYAGEVDLSDRFHPPWRRMRSLGGHAITTAVLDLADLGGDLRLRAEWHASSGETAATRHHLVYQPPAGRLQVRVSSRGEALPARLILQGLDGTADPDFFTPGMETVDPRLRESGRNFLDSATGTEEILLPPGRYRVTAGHGIEYSLAGDEVALGPDNLALLELVLEPALDTSGWISADLHVHAAPSFDSFLPLDERLAGYLAAGVEVLVASDHHMLTDYGPAIAAMPSAAGRIVSLVGVETGLAPRRTGDSGHWTLFPFAGNAGLTRRWPRPEVDTVADIYRLFREGEAGAAGEPRAAGLAGGVIQVNHPRGIVATPGTSVRGETGASWFAEAGYDPGAWPAHGPGNAFLGQTDASGRYAGLDFDAVEVLNRFSVDLYRQVRRDWFSLLGSGLRRTGTANSDSHHRTLVGPGFPRNFVRLERDSPATMTTEEFCRAIRGGEVLGTTGPFIELTVADAGPGATVVPRQGEVEVRLRVTAAGWIPVQEARLIQAGRVVQRFSLPADPVQVERLDIRFRVGVETDTWILAEAGEPLAGPGSDPGDSYRLLAPGFVPLAFTNPIFVDAGGDGWQPAAPGPEGE